jgi:hypothetical protein
MSELLNANPKVYHVEEERWNVVSIDLNDDERDEFTSQEVFDLVRDVNDPGIQKRERNKPFV